MKIKTSQSFLKRPKKSSLCEEGLTDFAKWTSLSGLLKFTTQSSKSSACIICTVIKKESELRSHAKFRLES